MRPVVLELATGEIGKTDESKYSLTFSALNRDKPVQPSLSSKKLTKNKREHRGMTSFLNNLETKLIITEDGHIVKTENIGPLAPNGSYSYIFTIRPNIENSYSTVKLFSILFLAFTKSKYFNI